MEKATAADTLRVPAAVASDDAVSLRELMFVVELHLLASCLCHDRDAVLNAKTVDFSVS